MIAACLRLDLANKGYDWIAFEAVRSRVVARTLDEFSVVCAFRRATHRATVDTFTINWRNTGRKKKGCLVSVVSSQRSLYLHPV